MKRLLTITSALLLCVFAHAQSSTKATVVNLDTLEFAETTAIYTNYSQQLDSLVTLWFVQKSESSQFSEISKRHYDSTHIPQFTNKEYKKRIEKMNSVVGVSYNSTVQSFINVYANKKRRSVSTMLGLAEHYFPVFEDIFEEYDIPQELKYLAVIESALNPKAKSPVGARGLWQFMPSTGKMYGLKVTSMTDERCDLIKSTHAAAAYLKNLYAIFDDWSLAIAAYNCGPGNVRKAISRAGGKRNFWDIYNFLPRETRGYVPAFIAAYYVFEHHEMHNIYPTKIEMPQIDTVIVKKKVHFRQIAEYLNVPLKELQDVNPQYKCDMVPFSEEGSPLYLPVEIVGKFLSNEEAIYTYKDSIYQQIQPTKEIANSPKPSSNYDIKDKARITYTVKSGDTFSKIATKYGVPINALKSWNKRTSNMLHIGEKLVVYLPKSGKGNSASTQTNIAQSSKQTSVKTATKAPIITGNNANSYYTVRAGDTLWSIAQRYGTSVEAIQNMNGLASAKLSPGMNLRIQ